MPAERSPRRSDVRDRDRDRDRDEHRRRRHQDAIPPEAPPTKDAKKDPSETAERKDKKSSETSNLTTVHRSRSFSQREDRGTAAQDDRRSGRRLASEHGRWTDSRDRDRTTHRTTGSDLHDKREKPEAQGSDTRAWRHDKFLETEKNVNPPEKKRRQFREEKVPPESKPEPNAASEPSKDIQHFNSTVGSDRREETNRIHRPLNDFGPTHGKSGSFRNRDRGDRFNGSGFENRFRGRDNFGGRPGFQSSGGRVEKWKHDLYYEANNTSPTKNEEDPVAKVEALLSL